MNQSPSPAALRNENILLRRLLELSTNMTSEVMEMLSETTDKLSETTASLERANAGTETLLAKSGLLLAQHEDLLGLIACIERDETGGTLQ